jgi:tripartite-type tricarboxylate transporter receptor subunit TctC
MRQLARAALAIAALASIGGTAVAQDKYPSRPIELIVPWGPGGGADQVARKIAKIAEPMLGVSLPVVNVAGANGVTGLTKMLSAEPDGYTVSVMTGDTFAMLATSQPKWKFEDFVPLAVMIRQPSAFFVAEDGKFKTWDDVVAAAKAGPIKVGITGFGSPDEMSIKYMNKKLGTKFIGVPFARPGERYSAILGGHADLLYEQLGDVRSFLEGKQMRPVLIFAEKRFPAFKDVPVSAELGHEIILPQVRMVIARAGTSPQMTTLLSDTLAKVAKDPEYVAYLEEQYAEADSFVAGDEARAFLQGELNAMKKLAQ